MSLFLALGLSTTALAGTEIGASRPFGLGLQLGTFSGLTGKLYLTSSRRTAIDFSLGTGYGDVVWNNFHAHVTYSWHFSPLTSGRGVTIPWRVGIGGFVNSGDYWVFDGFQGRGVIVGARVPIGLDFDLEEAPVQLYVEIAPNVALFPGVAAGLGAGLGGRFYF